MFLLYFLLLFPILLLLLLVLYKLWFFFLIRVIECPICISAFFIFVHLDPHRNIFFPPVHDVFPFFDMATVLIKYMLSKGGMPEIGGFCSNAVGVGVTISYFSIYFDDLTSHTRSRRDREPRSSNPALCCQHNTHRSVCILHMTIGMLILAVFPPHRLADGCSRSWWSCWSHCLSLRTRCVGRPSSKAHTSTAARKKVGVFY
mmetsp:Transcript_25332/g.54499  ORF Transcript_25332/g.54499 Transcript_25332/m.54499 type:complete len:202 (+) Transcript_25332:566-1171(+)